MAKYGSSSLAVLLADGVSLLPLKIDGLVSGHKAMQAPTTGLGDSWPEKTPTGMQEATLTIGAGFYETAVTGSLHEQFMASGATARIVCVAFEGDVAGGMFVGHAGAYSVDYEILAKHGDLTKAKVVHSISGAREEGVILQVLAAKTIDWNTQGAESVDNGASSANGGSGYLEVTAFSGFSGVVVTFQDSVDDVTYATLVACANVTSAPTAQRVTVAGTVDRYLAIDGNVTGSGSVTCWAGFARNA